MLVYTDIGGQSVFIAPTGYQFTAPEVYLNGSLLTPIVDYSYTPNEITLLYSIEDNSEYLAISEPAPITVASSAGDLFRRGDNPVTTTIYRTSDGDILDDICWRYYGTSAGVTEATLDTNPGLADLGPRYASGVQITLPDLPASTAPAVQPVRLWD